MQAQASSLVRAVCSAGLHGSDVVASRVAAIGARFARSHWRILLFPFKLLSWLADNSFVQRSAVIAGLSLALGGIALASLSEWASGRFGGSPADGSPPASAASKTESGRYAILPPLPVLPEGDHLPANAPSYTFRHDVPEVRLQFTVADDQGRSVDNLSAANIRVLDNQSPVERFSDFERDENLPLQLGLILDASDSVKKVMADQKSAASHFLDRVMRPQSDHAFVMAFGGDVRVWQDSTSERQPLMEAIARVKQPGWGTRLYDALYSACNRQSATEVGDSQRIHRAIVVLSDGDDTESLRGLADVIATAQRSEIQIYALTIHSPKLAQRGDWVLQRLTDATGGRFYVASSSKDLDRVFAQIERDLRTQYYVSFRPQHDSPGFHSLRVDVPGPQKLQVHARQGYYAMAQ